MLLILETMAVIGFTAWTTICDAFHMPTCHQSYCIVSPCSFMVQRVIGYVWRQATHHRVCSPVRAWLHAEGVACVFHSC